MPINHKTKGEDFFGGPGDFLDGGAVLDGLGQLGGVGGGVDLGGSLVGGMGA